MNSTSSSRLEKPGWKSSSRGWTWLIVLISGIIALLAFTEREDNWGLFEVLLVALLSAWFFLQVRRSRILDDHYRGAAFLTVMTSVLVFGVVLSDWMQLLLFIAYPLCWLLSPGVRSSLAWTWAVTAGVGFGLWVTNPVELTSIATHSLIVGVFSSAMGLWITGIVSWGQERGQMRRHIEESQRQVLELNRRRAAQEEREHLSREIHDTLAQGFVSVVTLSQAATPVLEEVAAKNPRVHQAIFRLEQIEQVARDNLAEARALVRSWKPPSLEGHDLKEALERLGEGLKNRAGITADIAVEAFEEGTLSPDNEVALLRVSQELFTNIERHAQATRVRLTLHQSGTDLELTVEDNGVGRNGEPEGTGLTGIRERISLLGGTIAIGDDNGTTVEVRIPGERNND